MQGSFVQKGASLQSRPAAKISCRTTGTPRKTVKTTIVAQAVAEAELAVNTGSVARRVDNPPGTPIVPPQDILSRPRRNRRSPSIRGAISETFITPSNLILPVFIHDGEQNIPISSMPGVDRLGWRHGLLSAVAEARSYGVNSVVLFPKTPEELKTRTGEEAFNPDGLVQRSIRLLKDKYPDLEIYTDVALDPYNSDGHDGIVRDDGVILNDETVEFLCRQAVSQARAGADCVSPSDMMDGRVGAIRRALDREGFSHVSIMSYTAKYASAYYGPFRDALASAPKAGEEHRVIPSNKKTYQQDPANYREALREARLDEAEGADIMMVKPGLPYLDVIRLLRDNSPLPIAAYHVSGEYAMLKAAAERGWLDEREAVLEALLSFRRAGADIILTYYATQAAKWMAGEE
ncbi:Delta-aminolevulinic acid dehydratase, chloroplastic [Coccomyxa sp. Obi]|nr:Delta-aminolevulinic acid dehydratase, chloroplastic [Coccomyxa sp. Obi]